MVKLWDLIVSSAEAGVKLQAHDGSMPAGHNGPHKDPDTPVRNTAHWVITFLKAYEYTKNDDFKNAAKKAADYLISKEARPMNTAFWCRKNPEKDFSNGLIGQAWVIEALALASYELEISIYKEIAKEVFLFHPFDEKIGLWRAVNVDGSYQPINVTFNQQLWFATSGTLLLKNEDAGEEISFRVNRFLEIYPKYFHIHKNGLIRHQIQNKIQNKTPASKLKRSILNLYRIYHPQYHDQEIGYHSFNLYALALLRNNGWLDLENLKKNHKFINALHYSMTQEYRDKISKDKYAFSYNPTGFEIAFVIDNFSDCICTSNFKLSEEWVNEQIKKHYYFEKGLMCKNTTDPKTLAARIYEATRLPNTEINL